MFNSEPHAIRNVNRRISHRNVQPGYRVPSKQYYGGILLPSDASSRTVTHPALLAKTV